MLSKHPPAELYVQAMDGFDGVEDHKYFLKFKNKRNIITSVTAGLRRGEKKVIGSLTVFIPKGALPRGSAVIFNTSKLS